MSSSDNEKYDLLIEEMLEHHRSTIGRYNSYFYDNCLTLKREFKFAQLLDDDLTGIRNQIVKEHHDAFTPMDDDVPYNGATS